MASQSSASVHHFSESEQGVTHKGGIEFHAHRCRRGGPKYWDWGDDWSASLADAIRAWPTDDLCVIHLDSVWAAEWVHRLAAKAGCRVAVVAHGMGVPRGHALQADRIVVLREDVQEELLRQGVPADRLVVTRPTVDDQLFARRASQPAGDTVRFGFVGMLTAYKGTSTLIQTVRALGRAVPANGVRHVVVDVVGKGLDSEASAISSELRDAAAESPHGVEVILHGQQPAPSVSNLLRSWDALLHPSYTEGMPIVVLEAMSVGVPVVAVDGVLPREMQRAQGVLVQPREKYAEFVAQEVARFRTVSVDRSLVMGHAEGAELFDGLAALRPGAKDVYFSPLASRWWRYRPARAWAHRNPMLRNAVRALRRRAGAI